VTPPPSGFTRQLGTERAVIKEPIWKPEIPFYFYFGGLGGASAGLALLSELRGNHVLARRAWATALAGAVASPVLLISDLGMSSRFLNMLRMFKVTSPMSVGSWLLAAFGSATGVAALDAWTGVVPSPFGTAAKGTSAVFGLPLTTYTAALIVNTAVPVWHEAKGELPVVFAAGGATSAGAAALLLTPRRAATPAVRLAVGGAAVELAALTVMERRLGELARPYHHGPAAMLGRVAKALTLAGAGLGAARAHRSRAAAIGAGALLTTGAVLTRWSIFKAGSRSAAHAAATVGPQRERIERGETAGAIRVHVRRPE
jgi:Polysulphide reductase, NrfD